MENLWAKEVLKGQLGTCRLDPGTCLCRCGLGLRARYTAGGRRGSVLACLRRRGLPAWQMGDAVGGMRGSVAAMLQHRVVRVNVGGDGVQKK